MRHFQNLPIRQVRTFHNLESPKVVFVSSCFNFGYLVVPGSRMMVLEVLDISTNPGSQRSSHFAMGNGSIGEQKLGVLFCFSCFLIFFKGIFGFLIVPEWLINDS